MQREMRRGAWCLLVEVTIHKERDTVFDDAMTREALVMSLSSLSMLTCLSIHTLCTFLLALVGLTQSHTERRIHYLIPSTANYYPIPQQRQRESSPPIFIQRCI